ncbi:MAG TPA: hypothetical protein DCS97_16250 [Planctomycetes bacterium]|nr:hypothetical protein [Planctomycetota bacterium]
MDGFQPLCLGMRRFRGEFGPTIDAASPSLIGLLCSAPEAGDFRQQVATSTLLLERDCWVLLAVSEFGEPAHLPGWQELPHGLVWRIPGTMRIRADRLVARRCAAGQIAIPGNTSRSPRGFWSRPHLILVADELPAQPGPGEDGASLLAEATRVESIELHAGDLHATVQIRPCLRLTAFRRDGIPSLIATGGDPSGLRTWFMAPAQDGRSPLIGLLSARCVDGEAARCVVTTGREPTSGLEVLWEVGLDPASDRLHLRQGLRNHGTDHLRLACWSILVGANPERTKALLLRDLDSTRPALRLHAADHELGTPFSLSPGPWPDTDVHELPEGLAIDPAQPAGRSHIKVGLRSREGLCALIDGDTVLMSRVAAEEPGPYPEGDLNLTSYRSRDIIEVEHVGPLTICGPGETLWLEQELRTTTIPGISSESAGRQATRIRAAWAG